MAVETQASPFNQTFTHDLSRFGGLTLAEVIDGSHGFITTITYEHKGELRTAELEEISSLSRSSINVIKFTESPDIVAGVEEIYPVIKFKQHIDYNNQLLATFTRPDFIRQQSQKQAALEILTSTFEGMSTNQSQTIINKWINALSYYNNQFTVRTITRGDDLGIAESYLMIALGEIGINEVLSLNNSFPRAISHRLKKLDPEKIYPESTYGIGRVTAVLPFILPIDQKPDPELINQASGGKEEVRRSLTNLTMLAEKLIAKSTLKYLKNNPDIQLASIPRRYIPVLELFVKGYTQEEIGQKLGIKIGSSINKNFGLFMSQFSFGRSPGNPTVLRESKFHQLGREEVTSRIKDFCQICLDYKVPFSKKNKSLKKAYQELSIAKMFAKRWLELSPEQQTDLTQSLLFNKATNTEEISGIGVRLIQAFTKNFDSWLLDESSIEIIFAPKSEQLVGYRDQYNQLLQNINVSKLKYILPEKSQEIILFVEKFLSLLSRDISKSEVTKELSEQFHYESSYVSIMHKKACLLSDLVSLSIDNSKGFGADIFEAWTILEFVDKAKNTL